jgi:hypothetical protein
MVSAKKHNKKNVGGGVSAGPPQGVSRKPRFVEPAPGRRKTGGGSPSVCSGGDGDGGKAPSCIMGLEGAGKAGSVRQFTPTKQSSEGIGVSIQSILVDDFQPGRELNGAIHI